MNQYKEVYLSLTRNSCTTDSPNALFYKGPVMFDESGDRQGLTQIEQLQNGEEVRVGFYNPSSTKRNKITWNKQTPIQWQGNANEEIALAISNNH